MGSATSFHETKPAPSDRCPPTMFLGMAPAGLSATLSPAAKLTAGLDCGRNNGDARRNPKATFQCPAWGSSKTSSHVPKYKRPSNNFFKRGKKAIYI